MSEALDDFRWLASPAAAEWLRRIADELPATPALVRQLRRELSPGQTHLLLQQADLRRRALEKFPQAGRMLFTRKSLEQSTDAWVARFKADRFHQARLAGEATVHDLCCGMGGDALALAAGGPCRGVDRDPLMTWLTAYNAEACGVEPLAVECADVTALAVEGDLWHIDPDRRAGGRRHSRVEGYQPGLDFLGRLVRRGRGGAMKLAPAAELPETLREGAEQQWISRGGECKQQLAWYGELAHSPECRTATVLGRTGQLLDTVSGEADAPGEDPQADAVGRYVFDPDAAVLAARLVGRLAAEHGLAILDSRSSYLTADHLPEAGSLAAFEVQEVAPLDVRRLRQLLQARGMGAVELKKRGVAVDLTQLARKLRGTGSASGTVIVSRLGGATIAIVGRRVTTRGN